MINLLKSLLKIKLKKECEMENMETITNEKSYRFKIDWKKWKAALDELLAKREEWPKLMQELAEGKKTFKEIGWEPNWKAQLTMLYSIRAQARGRLHRQTAKLTYHEWKQLGHLSPGWQDFASNNGVIKFPLTLDDQAAYIGDSWKGYQKHE